MRIETPAGRVDAMSMDDEIAQIRTDVRPPKQTAPMPKLPHEEVPTMAADSPGPIRLLKLAARTVGLIAVVAGFIACVSGVLAIFWPSSAADIAMHSSRTPLVGTSLALLVAILRDALADPMKSIAMVGKELSMIGGVVFAGGLILSWLGLRGR